MDTTTARTRRLFKPHKKAAIVRLICSKISRGTLVDDACKDVGIRRSTLHLWCQNDTCLMDTFVRARESQAHALAEETIRLADSAVGMDAAGVQAVRLQVDTRKWFTSKIAAKIYGENTRHVELTGAGGGAIQVEDVGQLRDTLTARLAGIASRRKLLTATARVVVDDVTVDAEVEPEGESGTA